MEESVETASVVDGLFEPYNALGGSFLILSQRGYASGLFMLQGFVVTGFRWSDKHVCHNVPWRVIERKHVFEMENSGSAELVEEKGEEGGIGFEGREDFRAIWRAHDRKVVL